MPVAIVLRGWLKEDRPGAGTGTGTGPPPGSWAHAALFHLVGEADPERAASLHASPLKPFSLAFLPPFSSSLRGERKGPRAQTGNKQVGEPGLDLSSEFRPLELRIALLEDALFPLLMDCFLHRSPRELTLGPAHFFVEEVRAVEHPWAGQASYEALWAWAGAEPQERVRLRFLTPTAFRRGDFDHPLPDPLLLIRSWAARWRQFSPLSLPKGLLDEERLPRLVGLRSARVRTIPFHDGHTIFPGFVGWVELLFRGSEEERRALTALAAYAFWAGSGRKTPYGAGLTRPLLPWLPCGNERSST